MRKLLLLTLFIIVATLTAAAQNYTVYSFSRGVQVESGGKTVAASEGMTVKPNDFIIIPKGGAVSIHDKASGNIYTSTSAGKISVTKLKIEATRTADSKTSSMISGMGARLGGSGSSSGVRVYSEKGMVNRSLSVYDPDGDDFEMDPETLARYVASRILNVKNDSVPLHLAWGPSGEDGGLGFRLDNTLRYPVYFNVLRLKTTPAPEIEISSLGQPGGSYVVQPRQSIQREQFAPLPQDEKQIMIITPCQFDLDGVIERVNTIFRNGEDPVADESTPACVVFML